MVIPIALFAFVFFFGSIINAVLHFSPTKSTAWLASLFTIQSFTGSQPSREALQPRRKNQDSNIRRVFATFDRDGDGFITRFELKDSLENLGLFVSEHDLASLVHKFDANGDGSINILEFCSLYESIGGQTAGNRENGRSTDAGDGELREAFDVFDENGDGFITVEELGSVLCSLGLRKGFGMEECREMIGKVDLDGDGRVNFKEFQQMMKAGGISAIS